MKVLRVFKKPILLVLPHDYANENVLGNSNLDLKPKIINRHRKNPKYFRWLI